MGLVTTGVGVGTGVFVGSGVAVGGTGVGVSVGSGVAVGGTGVAVGGTGVGAGGTGVGVGGTGVAVGGTGVAVGGTGVGVGVAPCPNSKHPITLATIASEISELIVTMAIRAFIASCNRVASAQMTLGNPLAAKDSGLLATAAISPRETGKGARRPPKPLHDAASKDESMTAVAHLIVHNSRSRVKGI
ncbi:MAG: hypothetical protein OXC83_01180 [Chloroflexi bacterium]|nr:hypothetical protein [Chloroflexota bacterium]